MCPSIEIDQDLLEQIDGHLQDGETREEFIQELVNHYESEGNALWEGYGGPP